MDACMHRNQCECMNTHPCRPGGYVQVADKAPCKTPGMACGYQQGHPDPHGRFSQAISPPFLQIHKPLVLKTWRESTPFSWAPAAGVERMVGNFALLCVLCVLPTASAFSPALLNAPARHAVSVATFARGSPATVASCRRATAVRMASTEGGQVDAVRVASYFGATGAEVIFITAAMAAVQFVGAQLPPLGYKILACIFFAAMSLKSRVFAILDARSEVIHACMHACIDR